MQYAEICFKSLHFVRRWPFVKRVCCIPKSQLEVFGNPALDLWKSQPFTAVFTFPSRGKDGWSRILLSKAGELIHQWWLSCRDYNLEFWVRDCHKCLLLQQLQIVLNDRSIECGTIHDIIFLIIRRNYNMNTEFVQDETF